MAQVDPQKVISKLGINLSNTVVQAIALEVQLEDTLEELARTQHELAEARTELAKLSGTDN